MEFRNLTPFPAIAFDALDQRDVRFRVLVMRLTFEIERDGKLVLAREQTPLVATDEFHGTLNLSSVRQESDFAPYKPCTDIIVVAHAFAPQGRAVPRFPVALTVTSKDLHAPTVACDKRLIATGHREWRKRNLAIRALSLFALPQWYLTKPAAITELPLRYEYAYGGENRILVTDPSAARVSKNDRLSGRTPQAPDACAANPAEAPAIAHSVCNRNPVGRGHADAWFLKATKTRVIPVPQIEAPGEPIGRFGKAYGVHGMGIVGRAWEPRLALAGTYDETWLERRHPNLPADFDFAYWNGAPADQQVEPHLAGDETVTLTNLCPSTMSGAKYNASGDTELSFALPGNLPFALVRFEDGRLGELSAKLDTLIIDTTPDPDAPAKKPTVVCVWRATVAAELQVRVLEARMVCKADADTMRSATPATHVVSPDSITTA